MLTSIEVRLEECLAAVDVLPPAQVRALSGSLKQLLLAAILEPDSPQKRFWQDAPWREGACQPEFALPLPPIMACLSQRVAHTTPSGTSDLHAYQVIMLSKS